MDRLTKEQKHRCMSAIKGRNTKPELLVRKFLFSRGFQYILNHPRLSGHPDVVIFLDDRRIKGYVETKCTSVMVAKPMFEYDNKRVK